MQVLVTGSSGLIGTALIAELRRLGHDPVPLKRSDGASPSWDIEAGRIDDLTGFDAVVHLAGVGIGDARWTDEYKRKLVESRTLGTTLLSEHLAQLTDRPGVLLSASAVGYYGETGDEAVTESSPPGHDFLAHLCVEWEAATAAAAAAGIRVAHLRTGLVLSANGGLLPKMTLPFKLGVGGKLGGGGQWWSWISLRDEVRAIIHLLENDVDGPVNLVAPTPVTNAEFTTALGRVLHRPTILPVPKFSVSLLLGKELAESAAFTSTRAVPQRLVESGFEFEDDELESTLERLLG